MHATIELHSLILSVPSYPKHYKPLSRVIYIELFNVLYIHGCFLT